jgi:hypothetical protein
MCISKRKTDKHKWKQNTPVKKKLESKEIQTRKTKNKICTKRASENLMQQIPWETKKSKKILFDGKAVLLVVPWVRVDSDLFISLLSIYDFHDDTAFLKINVQLQVKRKGSRGLP